MALAIPFYPSLLLAQTSPALLLVGYPLLPDLIVPAHGPSPAAAEKSPINLVLWTSPPPKFGNISSSNAIPFAHPMSSNERLLNKNCDVCIYHKKKYIIMPGESKCIYCFKHRPG